MDSHLYSGGYYWTFPFSEKIEMSLILWVVLVMVVVMFAAPIINLFQNRLVLAADPVAVRHITTRTIFALLSIEMIRRM
jgi:hypothetical protein